MAPIRVRWLFLCTLLVVVSFGASSPASGSPIGPVYPPPGLVSSPFFGGGLAGDATGRTLFFPGFSTSSYSELDWTLTSVINPYHSYFQGFTGYMAFNSYDPTTRLAWWESTAPTQWLNRAGGLVSVHTLLQVQFQQYTGTHSGLLGPGPSALTPTTAGALGIGSLPSNQSVLDVDALPGSDAFQVWFRYVLRVSPSTPLFDYYDADNAGFQGLQTSLNGGFYFEYPLPVQPPILPPPPPPPTPVPEPATIALLGIGTAALALRRKRAR